MLYSSETSCETCMGRGGLLKMLLKRIFAYSLIREYSSYHHGEQVFGQSDLGKYWLIAMQTESEIQVLVRALWIILLL